MRQRRHEHDPVVQDRLLGRRGDQLGQDPVPLPLFEVGGPVQGLLLEGAGQLGRVELVHQPVDAAVVGAHVAAAAAVVAQDQPVFGRGGAGVGDDRPPGVVAGVLPRRAAGHQLPAHRRVRPVRADKYVGVVLAAVGQPDRDPVRVLLVPVEPGRQADVLPADGVGQQVVQLGPVHQQELVVLGAELRGVEQASGRVVEVHLAGLADGPHLRADAEFVEDRQGVGPQPQPGPGGADLRRLLVDHHVDTGAPQGQPAGQAHDPGSDHHSPRAVHCVLLLPSCLRR